MFIYTHTSVSSGTTQVSQYQKGKTNLDFAEATDSEWQCHQLGHMQVCTSLQTDNHANTSPLSFLQAGALPAAQPTASKHRTREIKPAFEYLMFIYKKGLKLNYRSSYSQQVSAVADGWTRATRYLTRIILHIEVDAHCDKLA